MRIKLKTLILILSVAMLYNTYGQGNEFPKNNSSDTLEIVRDFNGDKINDKIVFPSTNGDISNALWKIKDGKSGRTYALHRFRFDNYIKSYTWLSTQFENDELEPAIDYIIEQKHDYQLNKRPKPDASLQWLINYSLSEEIICDSTVKMNIIKPVYTSENPMDLRDYYIKLKGDTLNLLQQKEDGCSWSQGYEDFLKRPDNNNTALVFYWGHSFFNLYNKINQIDSLYNAKEKKFTKVFLTNHGVFIEENQLYGWIYVSDHCLTGSSLRQRHPSIYRMKVINGMILLLGDAGTAIVDIHAGRLWRLHNGFHIKYTPKEMVLMKWLPGGSQPIRVKGITQDQLLTMLICR